MPNLFLYVVKLCGEAGFLEQLEVIGFSSTFFDDLNTIEQEAFALANLRLGYEYEDYGFYTFANNLLDTEYVTQRLNLVQVRSELVALPEPLTCRSEPSSKRTTMTSTH